jgi:hypothetical protein
VAGDVTTTPNPVIRIRADLREPWERTYSDNCPIPEKPVPGWRARDPNERYYYEDEGEQPRCLGNSPECGLIKATEFISKVFGWVPVVGQVADGLLLADDITNQRWDRVGQTAVDFLLDKLPKIPSVGGLTEKVVANATWDSIKNHRARDAVAGAAGSIVDNGADMICADTPDYLGFLGFCMF